MWLRIEDLREFERIIFLDAQSMSTHSSKAVYNDSNWVWQGCVTLSCFRITWPIASTRWWIALRDAGRKFSDGRSRTMSRKIASSDGWNVRAARRKRRLKSYRSEELIRNSTIGPNSQLRPPSHVPRFSSWNLLTSASNSPLPPCPLFLLKQIVNGSIRAAVPIRLRSHIKY